MSINSAIIQGNLTRDPELKFLPKGTAVCEISLAHNRRWKSDSGEMKESVSFFGVKCFGITGENLAKHFKKGSPIIVEGYLDQETWDDKTDGKKREKTKVIALKWHFCGGEKRTESAQQKPDQGAFVPPPPKSDEVDDGQVPF